MGTMGRYEHEQRRNGIPFSSQPQEPHFSFEFLLHVTNKGAASEHLQTEKPLCVLVFRVEELVCRTVIAPNPPNGEDAFSAAESLGCSSFFADVKRGGIFPPPTQRMVPWF